MWDEAVACNLMVAAVNLLDAGYEEVGCGGLPASAAQARILEMFWDDATHFLLEAGPPPGRSAIRDYLRLEGEGYTPHQTVAMPLDDTGGVPDVAGYVDLAAVLEGFDPALAKTVREPTLLLPPPHLRPPLRRQRRVCLGRRIPSSWPGMCEPVCSDSFIRDMW